jgi:hypothetical protein
MNKNKYIEELNLASGTIHKKASEMRPVIFKDKKKYNRKKKHKNYNHNEYSSFSLQYTRMLI